MSRRTDPSSDTVDTEALAASLDRPSVEFAVLFGSNARGDSHEGSDVDIAVRFSEELSSHDRFRLRNRIDADLQAYADGFVDVSDIAMLPTPVAYAAIRDGIVLVGESEAIESFREQVTREYEATADDREQARHAFIERLARGDV